MQEVASVDEGQRQVEEINWEDEAKKLKSTNDRLLAESQKNKVRNDELERMKNQLAEIEKKKLEEEGNLQELLKREREEKAKLLNDIKSKESKIVEANVYNAVLEKAGDAWSVKDLLLQQDYVRMIELDEESLAPTAESVEAFVNKLKEEKSYLFQGKKPAAMADAKPVVDHARTKNFTNMNASEKQSAFQEALAKAFQARG